eukprot:TRINITY_DN4403_c0_g1_i1.p1 TRINITY_DN4403_c0_g1~~TRINITY_DN4403_c0_g1_i1.p1  ORF type:complete len:572 (+),score=90.54 TRINITY_DN4403_c0_g1_i1:71-1717(+)
MSRYSWPTTTSNVHVHSVKSDGIFSSIVTNVQQKNFKHWSVELETEVKLPDISSIINEPLIIKYLDETKKAAQDPQRVRQILQTAREHALLQHDKPATSEYVQGLTLEETATLLNVDEENEELMNELFSTALGIKYQIYGNRIVLFAPLYLASYCVNTCTYCAFRSANKTIERNMLTTEELIEEVQALERQGHKRILVLTGEHPKYTYDHFLEALKTIKTVHTGYCGEIRRINVEIPALSISDFKRLKALDCVGTYTLFQETYHYDTFKRVHPGGPKSDYAHRLLTMDRAQIAGIDDVGIGALFGLYDYKFEVMGLLMHANHLERTYRAGPHTISIPRMKPALNAPDALNPPSPVSDKQFKKLVAVIRCAVPYTGMILSTRESPEMRRELLNMGVSQMSAGSKTDVGAYHRGDSAGDTKDFVKGPETATKKERAGQFELSDERSVNEIVYDLLKMGYVPSWCTACYRKGRTGEAFMKIAKKGDIQNFCHPNSLLTLNEYLKDYADEKTRKLGEEVIKREKETLTSERAKAALERKMKQIDEGKRDLHF